MDKFKWDKLHVSVEMIRMRKKLFGISGWFGFNVLSKERLCSLNLSLRRRLVSPMYCKWQRFHCIMYIKFLLVTSYV